MRLDQKKSAGEPAYESFWFSVQFFFAGVPFLSFEIVVSGAVVDGVDPAEFVSDGNVGDAPGCERGV